MKSSVPGIAQKARLLLQNGEGVTSCSSSICGNAIATALKASAQYATFTPATAAAAKHPGAAGAPTAAKSVETPASTAPTPAAATAPPASKAPAAKAPAPGTPASAAAGNPASSSDGATGPVGTDTSSSSSSSSEGKSGSSGLLTAAVVLGLPAGAYYAYEQSKQQYARETGEPLPNLAKLLPPSLMPESVGALVESGKQAVANAIPHQLAGVLGGTADKPKDSSSDKLHSQKQQDAELGFTMLQPEEAAAAAAAAEHTVATASPAAGAATSAAGDAMSAAADEFPGSSGSEAEKGPASTSSSSSTAPAQTPSSSSKRMGIAQAAAEEDANRIVAAMSAVAAAATASTKHEQPPAAAAAAAKLQARPARTDAAPVAVKEQSDSELERVCRELGLAADLTPSGLIAVANAAGRGAASSSGAPVPPQMAQLNQATSDAHVLGTLLRQVAARQAQLQKELATAQQEAAWAEDAAKKREEALTEHFKELLREQSRIQQQITADAVQAAEVALLADTARAHNEERKQRGAVLDELRAKVNVLSLAFDQRTAQVKSAHEVHKISLGVLALSKALEEGKPIGEQLQLLAAGCPGDPVVAAVTSSLPASAAASGLPTLQQLQQQFKAVAREAAEAAYFSGEGDGGVLARLAAKLAVQLKVEATTADGGTDSKIAQAKMLVQQGRLLDAADAISAAATGTQAAAVVARWVENARARAAADQAVKLLQAHATTTATMAAGN